DFARTRAGHGSSFRTERDDAFASRARRLTRGGLVFDAACLYRRAPSLAPTRLASRPGEPGLGRDVSSAARGDRPRALDSTVAHAEDDVVQVDDDADVVRYDAHTLAHAGAPACSTKV